VIILILKSGQIEGRRKPCRFNAVFVDGLLEN
jgi:hypothetical protein